MLITEGLELAISPGIKDPVLNTRPARLGIVLRLIPVGLDLGHKAVLAGSGFLLSLLALSLQEGGQLGSIPAVVRGHDVVVPVLVD